MVLPYPRLFAVLVLALAPTVASGNSPDLPRSDARVAGPSSVYITPAGTGPTLAARGATVTVEVRSFDDQPIEGYPLQDIVLGDSGNGDLAVCPGGAVADANTDADGITTISGSIAGGGWTLEGVTVYLGGVPIAGAALPIDVNSPDVNGDRVVDLTDVGLFAASFGDDSALEIDFNHDGNVDIADFGLFAQHVGESCP